MNISIVTPVFNGERFISETIESVIGQKGNFSVEYIIVDGLSTDGTVGIIRHYQQLLEKKSWPVRCKSVTMKFISQRDRSMYEATNKGFAIARGDILAYINADDIYLPGAFQHIAAVFEKHTHIRWLKGITSYIDETSAIRSFGQCYLYDRNMIQRGAYGRYTYFIQQDSVFWRRDLWEACGPFDTKYMLAGDFYLWSKFAGITTLYSLAKYVSCFRIVKGQLSRRMKLYRRECNEIIPYDRRLHFRYTCYHHFQYRAPGYIARIASLLLLGLQNLHKVIVDKNRIFTIKQSYYV